TTDDAKRLWGPGVPCRSDSSWHGTINPNRGRLSSVRTYRKQQTIEFRYIERGARARDGNEMGNALVRAFRFIHVQEPASAAHVDPVALGIDEQVVRIFAGRDAFGEFAVRHRKDADLRRTAEHRNDFFRVSIECHREV